VDDHIRIRGVQPLAIRFKLPVWTVLVSIAIYTEAILRKWHVNAQLGEGRSPRSTAHSGDS
jgi:hypothetical protein